MTIFRASFAILALAAMLGLVGCGGGSTLALDPTVTFTVDDSTLLPNLPATGVLVISGDAKTEDSETNPITSVRWTQRPALGTFLSPYTMNTSWVVTNPAAVTAPTPVTLTVEVKTLLGGKTVKQLHLLVQPVAP